VARPVTAGMRHTITDVFLGTRNASSLYSTVFGENSTLFFSQTFSSLCIRNLQIKISSFPQLFLGCDCFLQLTQRDVATFKSYGAELFGTFELIVNIATHGDEWPKIL